MINREECLAAQSLSVFLFLLKDSLSYIAALEKLFKKVWKAQRVGFPRLYDCQHHKKKRRLFPPLRCIVVSDTALRRTSAELIPLSDKAKIIKRE